MKFIRLVGLWRCKSWQSVIAHQCSLQAKLLNYSQHDHNCFPFGELKETTRTSSNYMNEDYPARPEV